MGPFIMREFSGKQKHSGKSERKREGGKHKGGSGKHDRDRGRAHSAGGRDDGAHRHAHGRGGGHHARQDGRSSQIEHYIIRGINILGLLVEWGLNKNFDTAGSDGASSSSRQGGVNETRTGYTDGYGNGWTGRSPEPPPSYPGYAGSFETGRIVVCTGKSCQRRWESGNLIGDLQREAAMRGVPVEITSCGCMDFCDEAPLVTVSSSGGAGMSSGLQPERYFSGVSTRDVPNIIDTIMYRRG